MVMTAYLKVSEVLWHAEKLFDFYTILILNKLKREVWIFITPLQLERAAYKTFFINPYNFLGLDRVFSSTH